jgi:hypothetical protein
MLRRRSSTEQHSTAWAPLRSFSLGHGSIWKMDGNGSATLDVDVDVDVDMGVGQTWDWGWWSCMSARRRDSER